MNLKNFNHPTLLVIAGPTAVGKTQFAIETALHYESVILSADSRQFYKEMKIGTAAPTEEEMKRVPHFFVGNLSIHDYYSVSRYEQDVLALLPSLFEKHKVVILTGGSGLYIDAVCYGIDDLPDPDPEVRQYVNDCFHHDGIESLRQQLKKLDPHYYETCNLADHKRMIRAIEVSLQMGQPYSSFLKSVKKPRPFDIEKIFLTRPREELFQRIHARTQQMMENGWLDEARALYPLRHLNALNTVGYKELFAYFDGQMSLEQAIVDIQTHTRRYAKRQMTWFQRDNSYQMLPISE